MPKQYSNWVFNNIRLNITENQYFVSISYLATAAGRLLSTRSNDCPLQVLNIPDYHGNTITTFYPAQFKFYTPQGNKVATKPYTVVF